MYQNRISELHEFIADAQVPKTEREAQYELLLSQAFQTQNISFVNQFFKSSLTRLNVLGRIFSLGSQYGQVKKRIVMLKKTKSKKVWQLKYLMLVPLVLGMLAYTSCKEKEKSLEERLEILSQEIEKRDSLTTKEMDAIGKMAHKMVEGINESNIQVNGWKVQSWFELDNNQNGAITC